jgi:HPt (histidine-containing phosphotransfer) domain-containing protein
MTSSSIPNGLTMQSGPSFQEIWSPPLFLLEAASGDDDLIADLIDAFDTDAGARMPQLRAALRNCDFSRIRAEAHAIKGSARQLGADALADACQELETASNLRAASLVAAWINRVHELLAVAQRAMASYSGNRRPQPSGTAMI